MMSDTWKQEFENFLGMYKMGFISREGLIEKARQCGIDPTLPMLNKEIQDVKYAALAPVEQPADRLDVLKRLRAAAAISDTFYKEEIKELFGLDLDKDPKMAALAGEIEEVMRDEQRGHSVGSG